MNKIVAVVVVSLCCWLVASAGPAMCNNKDQDATVNIVVGNNSFNYEDKNVDPVPCIYRESEILVTVDFSGAPNNQWIKLGNFRALLNTNPGNSQNGSWIRDHDDLAALEIQEKDGNGDWKEVVDGVLIFKKGGVTSKSIMLIGQRKKGVGPQRLITFQVAVGKGNDTNKPDATFDPPWGERP